MSSWANGIGCFITWICADFDWSNLQTLFIAAAVSKDDVLLGWIKQVMEARRTKPLSPEAAALFPDQPANPWLWSYERYRVSEKASEAVAALLQAIYDRKNQGTPKL